MQLAGELVILPHERPGPIKVKVGKQKKEAKFVGFNGNPYLCAFRRGRFIFTLANVHIYYGSATGKKFHRGVAEVYALARWSHQRVTAKAARTFDHDILLLGDFNVPRLQAADPVAKQLRRFGRQSTSRSSFQGTNLSGRNQYDQMAFHPGHTKNKFTGRSGVFDFDKFVLPAVWQEYVASSFHDFVRYHISDHRVLWSEWNNTIP